jgi:hypothetical protein
MGEGNGGAAGKHPTRLPLDRDLSKMLVAQLIKGESGKRFVSGAWLRQFGSRCHERGRAAITANQKSRKYKNPDCVSALEARKADVHLGRKLDLVAGSARCAHQWRSLQNPQVHRQDCKKRRKCTSIFRLSHRLPCSRKARPRK